MREKSMALKLVKKTDDYSIYLRGDINNPTIALEPGELRVFSCQPVAANMPNISAWTQSSAATNQLTVGRALEIDEIIYSDAGGSYVNAVYAQPESVVATGRLDAIDVAWSWRKGSGSSQATRNCHSTRSRPVIISVTGCSTCRRVFISMK